MDRRLRPFRVVALAALAVALLVCGPWVGWWTIIPLVLSGVLFHLADRGLEDRRFPEYRVAVAWVGSQLAIAASTALTGGPESPSVAWLAIPLVTLPARFSANGVRAGAVLTAALLVSVTVGVDAQAVGERPELLLFPLALVIAVVVLSSALMQSDLQHRNEAVIDPLTGMLNRNSLRTRAAELAQQAQVNGEPVALIVGDLDRFKTINDAHGHATGDTVLREVAYRLRKELRAYDLAYRLGGEEFLVVVPGGDLAIAADLAERLRTAIAGAPTAGLLVTMSFGAAASSPGSFDFQQVFDRADMALYEAKRAGRNRVHTRAEELDTAVAYA